jgi:hypothetical protein
VRHRDAAERNRDVVDAHRRCEVTVVGRDHVVRDAAVKRYAVAAEQRSDAGEGQFARTEGRCCAAVDDARLQREG